MRTTTLHDFLGWITLRYFLAHMYVRTTCFKKKGRKGRKGADNIKVNQTVMPYRMFYFMYYS